MGTKYFCCGLPRTGTQSLVTVAKMMGLRISHPRQGGIITYDEADFFADTPIWANWRELSEMYPDARFILTYRNEEAWLKSFLTVLGSFARNVLQGRFPVDNPLHNYHIDCEAYRKTFGSHTAITEERLPALYRDHNERVEDYFSDFQKHGENHLYKLLVIDITLPGALTDFVSWMDMPLVNFPKVR